MKSISFTVITLLVVAALIAGGYFALTSMRDPVSYVTESSPRVGDLHRLETEPQSTVVEPIPNSVVTEPTSVVTETSLKASLQAMIDKKVVLKIGSKGVNVGYVQQFMNIYFKKALKVDNDFGKTLEANVKAFQKATGVTQTGQVGPATLGKMVAWLDKNPQ